MKQPRRKSQTEKLSVSLSKTVVSWAVELADKKGFDTNFSAYIADLIRRDRERELAQVGFTATAGNVGRVTTELNDPKATYRAK